MNRNLISTLILSSFLMTGCAGGGGEAKLEGQPDTFKASTLPDGTKIEGRLFTKKGVFKGLSIVLSGPGAAVLKAENSTVKLTTSPAASETNVPAPAFKRIDGVTLECALPDFELPAGSEDLFVTMNLQTEGGGTGSHGLDVKIVSANDNMHAFSNKLSVATSVINSTPPAGTTPGAAPTASPTAPISNVYSNATKTLEQVSK